MSLRRTIRRYLEEPPLTREEQNEIWAGALEELAATPIEKMESLINSKEFAEAFVEAGREACIQGAAMFNPPILSRVMMESRNESDASAPLIRWIEIPSCRVLEVPEPVFLKEYERLDENGVVMDRYQSGKPAMVRRLRDEKLFKMARFEPSMRWAPIETGTHVYLEEF